MTRFADPTVCPDCAAALPGHPDACPRCRLPLVHPLTSDLFVTLQHADRLLDQLREVAAPVPTATAPILPAGPFVPPMAPMPAPTPEPRRTGLRVASVPAILLGLGALCLLVAALIFLAVAWSWLGVGGRTGVLAALTAASAGLGGWLAARGLRVAGEALGTVAFGLLTLDLVGADRAGWLGERTGTELALVVGLALVVAGLAWAFAQGHLATPQVVAGIGLLTAYAAAFDATGHPRTVEVLGVVAFGGLAVVGGSRRLPVLPWVGLAGAALCWSVLTLTGLSEGLVEPTLDEMWAVGGAGWALLAATAFLVAPAAASRLGRAEGIAPLAVAAVLAVVTLTLPVVDEGATAVVVAAIGVVGVGAAASAFVPRHWLVVPLLPAGLAALPVIATWLVLVLQAATVVVAVGEPFTEPATITLAPHDLTAHPALLVPSALAVVVLAWVPTRSTHLLVPGAAAVCVSAIATLALQPVPLWAVVVALLTVAGAATVGAPLLAAVALVAALAAGLPSAGLTGLTTVVAVVASVVVIRLGRTAGARSGARAALPLAVAGLLWSAGHVAGVAVTDRAIPVALVVGMLAVVVHRWEVETSGALAMWVTSVVAVSEAANQTASLALHLTVLGALVSAHAIVHRDRRAAGWLGGALLAGATWARLADLGVDVPEAYTLPSALALLMVGLDRLRRDPAADTGLALTPGLLLATVPSLLVSLVEPASTRAALLGAACLLLVLLGTRLRWNAPLTVGAAVGGLLVVWEVAPYAARTPEWVAIGLAGALLSVIGVTWERRVVELRRTAAYLQRLR